MNRSVFASDKHLTLKNRERLSGNPNLLYWYKKLYEYQFQGTSDFDRKKVLEIGSGTSPLKRFYPNIRTSDILELDYLDYIFDAHDIDTVALIEDHSLDIITMTNVLHHLRDPILFLIKASKKLVPGGKIICVEPYFSFLSKFIYLYMHHEHTNLKINRPCIEQVESPLSSANIALPFLIFFKQMDDALREIYDFSKDNVTFFSSLSYMVTGGISRTIRLPGLLYKIFFNFDLFISKSFPRYTASFFILQLTKR